MVMVWELKCGQLLDEEDDDEIGACCKDTIFCFAYFSFG